MESSPVVDVIVAVHSPRRPVRRAVASVLQHTKLPVRIIVVAHNTDADGISASLGEFSRDPRVHVLNLQDGIRSPAGPKNYGLEHAVAPFVSLLDSDDEFQPGAIDAWVAASEGFDVVLSQVVRGSTVMAAPPVRPCRQRHLSATKDRLSYRVGIWGGLIRRERFLQVKFAEGLTTGEDQLFAASLWFSGARIVFPQHAPGYVLHDDQSDRVTADVPFVEVEFTYLSALLDPGQPWSRRQPTRTAVAVKLLRTHIFDAFLNRAESWSRADAVSLAAVIEQIVAYSPRSVDLLSRADERALRGLANPTLSRDELRHLMNARGGTRSAAELVPRKWALVLHRQAPLRTLLAGRILVQRQRRRM